MSSNQNTNLHTARKTHLMNELLYDALMQQIEPELVTSRVDSLDFLYAGETPDERATRMQRYATAMVTFEDRLQELLGAWNQEVKTLRDELMAGIRRKVVEDDPKVPHYLDTHLNKA